MEHVVFYQSTQGTPAFRRLASLEDAVSFAEHLRNVEGVTDFSVYSLSPVTLSLRAYYHVEVSPGDATAANAPESAPTSSATSTSPFGNVAPPAAAPSSDVPDAPPLGSPIDAPSPTPAMSFNALEEEASAPLGEPPAPTTTMPFAAAPLPPAGVAAPLPETFVKDAPADLTQAAAAEPDSEASAVDPSVVDPTVEEVVPAAPTGRRSMGFFARS